MELHEAASHGWLSTTARAGMLGQHCSKRRLKVLVLTRGPGQTVILTTGAGERIKVVITKVSDKRCSVGFDAPSSVKVVRSEIEDKPDMEDKAA